jgi:hypothetical protein
MGRMARSSLLSKYPPAFTIGRKSELVTQGTGGPVRDVLYR